MKMFIIATKKVRLMAVIVLLQFQTCTHLINDEIYHQGMCVSELILFAECSSPADENPDSVKTQTLICLALYDNYKKECKD